jgi:hypothetical protein
MKIGENGGSVKWRGGGIENVGISSGSINGVMAYRNGWRKMKKS